MNFGNTPAGLEWFLLVVWVLPVILGICFTIWFIRTLSSIAASLGDIVARLDSLEGAVRDASNARHI